MNDRRHDPDYEPTPLPSDALPAADPRHATTRLNRPQPEAGLWRAFLAWPAGASLVYLVSAACLLAGAGMVLMPAEGDPRLAELLAIIGTVAMYGGALLGVACLVCRWDRDHDDAVALSVLLALLMPGAAAPLLLLAIQHDLLTWILAPTLFAGVVAAAAVWTRRVGGPLTPAVAAGAGLALLGAFALPGLLAAGIDGAPEAERLMPWWSAALWITAVGAAWQWIDAATTTRLTPKRTAIRSHGLRRALALAATCGAVLVCAVGAWTSDLPWQPAALLPALAPVLLAVDALMAGRIAGRERVAAWLVATLALAWMALPGFRAAGWHAAAGVVLLGVGALWHAWRARSVPLGAIAAAWTVAGGVAVAGLFAPLDRMVALAAGMALATAWTAIALAARSVDLAVLATGLGYVAAAFAGLDAPTAGGLAGAGLLAIHALAGARLHALLLLLGAGLAAWGVAAAVMPLAGAVAAGLLLAVIAWRDRARAWLAAPLVLPLLADMWALLRAHPAVAVLAAAFALLAAGALLSRRRRATR